MAPRLEEYEVVGVIGTGSFGTCYKVQHRTSKELYVWKAIDYGNMSEERKQLLVSEVNLLSELNHPNIVKYHSRIIHKDTSTLYIIMEWCQGGDLAALIRKTKQSGCWLDEGFIWKILYQLGRALQACHTRLPSEVTILHRDIKPANIFLDGESNVKLGDFGLARVLKGENSYSDTFVGTPYYMSPEVVKGHKYNRKSDVWGLGCLIYELCALTPPFGGNDMKQLAANIKAGRYQKIPPHYSEDLSKIISFLLSVQHEFRPTIEMVLHHPAVVLHVTHHSKPTRMKVRREKSGSREGNKASSGESSSRSNEAQMVYQTKALSITDRSPQDVTNYMFQEKWISRLEGLRAREAMLKDKEMSLQEKERLISRKEKHIALLERRARDKIFRAEVYLNQCRESKNGKFDDDHDSSYSADPGDTSLLPTTARIDPETILKPRFIRSMSVREKHVRFQTENVFNMDGAGAKENRPPVPTKPLITHTLKEPFYHKIPEEPMRHPKGSVSNLDLKRVTTLDQKCKRKSTLGLSCMLPKALR